MDRIDLYVDVDEVKHDRLLDTANEEPSRAIQQRVGKARTRQQARYGSPLKTNATMNNRDIKQRAGLTPEAAELLNVAAERLGISARAYMRLIKVARTIADLESSDEIAVSHISEALQYRRPTVANTL
jgi:magnesium chelatase family protein